MLALARRQFALATRQDGSDPLAQVVDAIDAGTWEQLAAPLIEPILTRAKADPDEALTNMDADALTERLASILFVADVWGTLQPDS